MASSFNRVILAGNMTRDPESRALPSGQPLTKFSLAINRSYTTKDGEKREEVTYVDIESYGKQAEIIAKYCTKGSGILVEGRLKLDSWDDKKTGEKRSRLGVVLENFTFIGGRAQGGSADGEGPAPRSGGARGGASPAPSSDVPEDDVPF
jgi:single-strand DNA-binding protein